MKEIEYALHLDIRPWRKTSGAVQEYVPYVALFAACESLRILLNRSSDLPIFTKYFLVLCFVAIPLGMSSLSRRKRDVKFAKKFVMDGVYIALVSASIINVAFFFKPSKEAMLYVVAELGGIDYGLNSILICAMFALLGLFYVAGKTLLHMRTENKKYTALRASHHFWRFRNAEWKHLAKIVPAQYFFSLSLIIILIVS